MSTPAELRCRCGQVRGIVADASPDAVNRVVCFCEDCQAFAHQLDRADLLDAKGGSDIVQVAPASLTFVQGQHHISGLRLTPKGLFRWYASCCKTPVGNTVSPAIPFVGIVVQAFDGGPERADAVFGKPIGAIFAKHSIGDSPVGSKGISLSLMARAIRMVLGWRLRGRTWPHPFFARETGAPIYPVTVLSQPQREALRPLCGPQSDGGETWSGMSRDLFGLPQQNALNLHRTALRNLARGRQATQTRRRLDAAMQDQPPDRLLARIAEIGHAPAHSASRRHRAVPGYGGPTDRGKFSTRPALYRHGKRTSRCGSAMP